MKRIAIIAVMLAASLAASATSVLYFTRSQADRAVSYLNRQNELMIYCGYDYEIETYVLLNEVWAERVNSAYYELWIYGYDAYTGEEIYMPIDLQCIWLYRAGNMYNAAQYLRFRTGSTLRRPARTWTVPAYNPYTRVVHRPGYVRTYHYDVHRYGWMPPTPPAPGHHGPASHPMHPYYMRAPQTPPPTPTNTWTPGTDRPHVAVETPAPAGSSTGTRPSPTRSSSSQSGTATPGTTGKPQGGTSTTAPTRSSSTGSSTSGTPSTTPTRSTTPARSDKKETSTTTTTTPTRNTAPARSDNKKTTTSSPSTPTRSTTPARNDNKQSTTTAAPTRSTTPARSDNKKSTTSTSAPTRK